MMCTVQIEVRTFPIVHATVSVCKCVNVTCVPGHAFCRQRARGV